MSARIKKNPFDVQTPEDMTAKDVNELFVDVFTDFYQVPRQGHTFLNGPRGSGKSMMFRFMMPDCQSLHLKESINRIDYFSIYIPIKKTEINIVNLGRHADILLNEHLLTMFVATICFESFARYFEGFNGNEKKYLTPLKSFYNDDFIPLIKITGYTGEVASLEKLDNLKSIFLKIHKVCNQMYHESLNYIRRLALSTDLSPYSGSICGYLDFLFPLLSKLKMLPLFPDSPIFLLIDDADNLNDTQKKVLNTWVSYRTSAEISLKISTQLNYNIFRTISGSTIDTPHDYSEVNIATVYTSTKNKYRDRLKEIVNKRLAKVNINVNAEDFFPAYEKQERRIREIYDKIKSEHPTKGRGYRPSDDAYRYATSEYIKELLSGRSGHTYCYAGFKELVHISSGIIRLFLDPAAIMYSEMMARDTSDDKVINHIDPMVQNEVIKEYSNQFMFQEFERIKKYEESQNTGDQKHFVNKTDKLRNLILGMGGLFHKILISDRTDRRVFSIALNDTPDEELSAVLNLGVQHGYLHESSIGDKTRTGRSKLYILNRRLAPFFLLDTSSFAGYKFINSASLKIALKNPKQFIRTTLKLEDSNQLFSEEEL